MIDLFLEKIKLCKGKGLRIYHLMNLFNYTEDYNEVKYIINYLTRYCQKISKEIYYSEVFFTEDYNDAKEIINNYYDFKVKAGYRRISNSIIYLYLIQTTDTLEEVKEVFEEMKNNNVVPSIGCYVELMKKQSNYEMARDIFEKYILIPEEKRIEGWKNGDEQDALREVYGILYLKAKTKFQLTQAKNELREIRMSTEIEDYYYLKEKTCSIRIRESKKMRNKERDTKLIFEYILKDEHKNNLNFSSENISSTKIKRTYNIYNRNRKIVEELKDIYNNSCQICGEKLELIDGYYSEVHHLHPLHLNGPDIIENMIVLCPNHHELFDRGSISIDLEKNIVIYISGKEEKIRLMEHKILDEFVQFNNKNIYNIVKNGLISKSNYYNKAKYGSKVIIMDIDNKEEFIVNIPSLKDELSYFEFKLLNSQIEDNINISGRNYFIIGIK